MAYFCGIISCDNKCGLYPDACNTCKKAEYTQAGSPNLVCVPDPSMEVNE